MTMTEAPLPTPSTPVPPAPPAPPVTDSGTVPGGPPVPLPSAPNEPADNGYVDKGTALGRLPKLPFELFLAMLVGLIMLAVVVVLSRSSLGDETARADDAAVELATVQSELVELESAAAAAESTNSELRAEIAALEAGEAAEQPAVEPVAVGTDAAEAVERLEAELSAANDRVAELENDLTSTESQLLDARTRLTAAEAEVAGAVVPSADDSFVQFVGETLASADGLRISADQSRCLGRTVVDDIGLGAFGAGLNSDRSSAANNVVIDSIVRAVDACQIDPRRVFGQ